MLSAQAARYYPGNRRRVGEFDGQLLAFVRTIGLEPTSWEFDALLSGAVVSFGPGHTFRLDGDRLLPIG